MLRTLTLLALAAALAWPMTGCETVRIGSERGPYGIDRTAEYQARDPGPPPWAPAHGFRRKMAYRYYFDSEVYYSPARDQWVWVENGDWRVGRRLPEFIEGNLGDYVRIDLEADRPWEYHGQIREYYPSRTKSRAVPPGQAKKDKARGNNW